MSSPVQLTKTMLRDVTYVLGTPQTIQCTVSGQEQPDRFFLVLSVH